MLRRKALSPAEWLDREQDAGRLPERLSPSQVAFLVDLIQRVAEREVARLSRERATSARPVRREPLLTSTR